MNTKRLVTIALITVTVMSVAILVLGLSGSTNGKPNWQIILDSWKGGIQNTGSALSQGSTNGAANVTGTQDNSQSGGTDQSGGTGSNPGASGGNGSTGSGSGSGSGSSGSSGGTTTPKPGSSSSPTTTPKPNSGGGGSTPAPTAAPTATPAPTPSCSAGGSCTSSQVAQHGSQNNCWVIYGSKVYDVTGYVGQHPPGPAYFNSNTCGHDITNYLNGSASVNGSSHHHSNSAYNILNTYWYANLI